MDLPVAERSSNSSRRFVRWTVLAALFTGLLCMRLDRGGRGPDLAPAGSVAERPWGPTLHYDGGAGPQFGDPVSRRRALRRAARLSPAARTGATPGGPGLHRFRPGAHVAPDDRVRRPGLVRPLPREDAGRAGTARLPRAAAGCSALPRAHLRALRVGAAAAGRFTALHREPRTARPTVSDCATRPSSGTALARHWSTRHCAASTSRTPPRAAARWPRRSRSTATRPKAAPTRPGKSCARWPRPRCAPTSTARTRCRGAGRSSSTTSTRCRCRPRPASARSTASATACGPSTAGTSPR